MSENSLEGWARIIAQSAEQTRSPSQRRTNMDGIFINGERPKSKKQVKEAIAADPSVVDVENTSLFDARDGLTPVNKLAPGEYPFVGPDPYTKRNFYGNIKVKRDAVGGVSIKVT